ncbi:MAG: NRDE family protein [Chitinophagales bacterium]|nr:NRDE family protein [Chitinophagales bacterium]
MCTVTFLPTGTNSFILTSNRDEHVNRPFALPPADYQINNRVLSFPKDPLGEGTWIAAEKNKSVVCLLNGAFIPHTRNNNYRKSRGLLVLDYFQYQHPADFAGNYNFENIEPFTLVIVNNNATVELSELRWDGERIHLKKLDANKPAIWSSCTLYDKNITAIRQRWFDSWLENKSNFEHDSIKEFHQNAGKEDSINGLIMARDNGMRTVCITSILCSSTSSEIHYSDIINGQQYLHST